MCAEIPPMHSLFPSFQKHLQQNYSTLPSTRIDSLTPQLASPLVLKLPKSIYTQAQEIVDDLYRLTQNSEYQKQQHAHFPFTHFQEQPSLLSSLDVHVNEQQQLKIIEINTNASSYLVNAEHYTSRSMPLFADAKQSLKQSFQKTFGDHLAPGKLFLIIDENPEQQNMYVEFLMYREFLAKEFSVRCEIADVKELVWDATQGLMWRGEAVSGIYNRSTDFYFKDSPHLAQAFQNSQTLLSPHPWGYALIADKNRLIEWNEQLDPQVYPHLTRALLKTFRFSQFKDADDLWSQRNGFFFKPPNAYGSRSVYKGKSISRTVFQRIFSDDFIAQEACAAPEVVMEFENQKSQFKYDLRFYFFENKIQLAIARLYQGQLTNLQTPLGGLTPLEFT